MHNGVLLAASRPPNYAPAMRVLLIEDYAPLQKAVIRGLQEAGYAVDAAADGENGAWLAQSNEYDVIVLDLMLPKMDGWSILEQLRRRDNQSHVLVLTARDHIRDRVRGLNLGADDYLVKPFAFEELLVRGCPCAAQIQLQIAGAARCRFGIRSQHARGALSRPDHRTVGPRIVLAGVSRVASWQCGDSNGNLGTPLRL